ncbi:MAG: hypothetical protein AAF585_04315 [Verrucomicrobiota bacterium]
MTDAASGKEVATLRVHAAAANDRCVRFEVEGLTPGRSYRGEFLDDSGSPLFVGAEFRADTPPAISESESTIL